MYALLVHLPQASAIGIIGYVELIKDENRNEAVDEVYDKQDASFDKIVDLHHYCDGDADHELYMAQVSWKLAQQ